VAIDERQRLALDEAAKETWGPEVAVTLMEMLPPAGWADVATKQDLVLVRKDLDVFRADLGVFRAEVRTEMADFRAEVRTEMADFRTTVERALRTSLMWTVTTMIAGFGAVTAVVGLSG
jgi:hypothetical protein